MSLREQMIARLDGGSFDVMVAGGGINGAVSAAALAARGLRVAVVDRGDFASVTSQESSNLIWGGFKYLENYELLLVAKLSHSRNKLMKAYPSSMKEVRFLATLDESAPFPWWLAALGSVGYWGIGRFATSRPAVHRPEQVEAIEPVVRTDTAEAAIEYSDGYLKDNDARFVWNFISSAMRNGGVAANYVGITGARREGDRWSVELTDSETGGTFGATATAMVNAAGPFIDGLNDSWGVTTRHRILYSKGIHLVVPKLTEAERVLAFFDDSQRLFYVIPMANRSVIGTTDTRTSDPNEGVTDDDRYFLLKQINARLDLATPLTTDDIISERCGVRPLVAVDDGDDRSDVDWTALSRKHEIEVDRTKRVVSVFGGKLTDCLNVGDEVVEAIAETGMAVGPRTKHWYGEDPAPERARFLEAAAKVGLDRPPEVEREDSVAAVLWRRHGRAANAVVAAVSADPTQGESVLAECDVLRGELPLFAEREMIVHLDDFLRRRTKIAMIRRDADVAADPGLDEVRAALGVT